MFTFGFAEQADTLNDAKYRACEQSITHQLRMSDLEHHKHLNLSNTVVFFHSYCPSTMTFYYSTIDYYVTRARKNLWDQPSTFWETCPLTTAEAEHVCKQNEALVNCIPTTLNGELIGETPLYAEISLLIQTNDEHIILDTARDLSDGSISLNFSLNQHLTIEGSNFNPIDQLVDRFKLTFQHELDCAQLSRLSVGIDCSDYTQQLVYLYHCDMNAQELLEQHKETASSLSSNKFACPMSTEFLFQLCHQFSARAALSYTLLKHQQNTSSKTIRFTANS